MYWELWARFISTMPSAGSRGYRRRSASVITKPKSGPLMKALENWFAEQFPERKVEPNSGLGQAITYMQNHWQKLTLFLRQPRGPTR